MRTHDAMTPLTKVLALCAAALPCAAAAQNLSDATPLQLEATLAEIDARYRDILAQLEDLGRQRRELARLIVRAEDLENLRGTGAEQVAPAAQPGAPASPGQPPVVAVERKDQLEAQTNKMPELPRVSPDIGGVLTPKGQFVVEPLFQYYYSSVSRVAVEGFTILPALLVGIIDVVEADRDTYMAGLSLRYGLTSRLEMELKGEYVYRDDDTRSREFLRQAVEDGVFHAHGEGAGDTELGLRYQFTRRKPTAPYIVGNLRYKDDNGNDPFEIATAATLAGTPQFSSELATGSGFRSLSPSLTFVYPTDPVVFFGSVGYLWTEQDDKGIRIDANGKPRGFGKVDPGDALRLNFGIGIGLNDRSSFSISYQLDKFSKTFIETASVQKIVGSDVTIGKLLVGYSLRTPSGAPLNLAFGIGTTADAADSDITFRMPFTFGD
ncbi:MAG TPA: acetate kinase [Gammaproteobacteria bacterium]|nr:acetate kinase [Gammaproteobacteria bacterium]